MPDKPPEVSPDGASFQKHFLEPFVQRMQARQSVESELARLFDAGQQERAEEYLVEHFTILFDVPYETVEDWCERYIGEPDRVTVITLTQDVIDAFEHFRRGMVGSRERYAQSTKEARKLAAMLNGAAMGLLNVVCDPASKAWQAIQDNRESNPAHEILTFGIDELKELALRMLQATKVVAFAAEALGQKKDGRPPTTSIRADLVTGLGLAFDTAYRDTNEPVDPDDSETCRGIAGSRAEFVGCVLRYYTTCDPEVGSGQRRYDPRNLPDTNRILDILGRSYRPTESTA